MNTENMTIGQTYTDRNGQTFTVEAKWAEGGALEGITTVSATVRGQRVTYSGYSNDRTFKAVAA